MKPSITHSPLIRAARPWPGGSALLAARPWPGGPALLAARSWPGGPALLAARSWLGGATALLAALLPAGAAFAEPTRELYISDVDEVLQGDPVSTSVDAKGRIVPGPAIRARGPAIGHAITAVAESRAGILIGTAGGGLHLLGDKDSRTRLLEAKDKIVTALLPDGSSTLVALAPKAEVVRVSKKQTKTSVVKLKAEYVWAMAEGKARTLLVTGKPGQVVAVDDDDRTEIWYESDEAHLRAIVRHPRLGWIVGGGQEGIVYQLVGNRRARALYDSKFEEVTALAVDPRTSDLYAAFVSSETSGKPLAQRWIGPTKDEKPDKDDRSPFKGSEVVRIRPSGQVEVLWSSNAEGAMSLAFVERRLYFSTGTAPTGRARVYAIDVEDRDRLLLWARLEPPLAPVLVSTRRDALLVGTAGTGQLYLVGPGQQREATYLSVEQDLARTARVGSVWFDADIPNGARVALSVRSGNTKKADDTWSDWSAAVTDGDGGPVDVPDARYVQLRAVLNRGSKGSPVLKSMHASVIRHNVAPQIREVFTLRRGIHLTSLPTDTPNEKTVTISKRTLDEMRKPQKQERRLRVRQHFDPGMMTVAWRVDDVDGDDLLYRVQMRRLDRPSPWREVAKNRVDNYWSFDSQAFPDGRYQFRVTASDRPSNPPADALTDTHVSEPVLVDNTAPALSNARASVVAGGRLRVEAEAVDRQSRIQMAEVSVDGGPWLMLPAADGLLDARREQLRVELSPTERGNEAPARGARTVRIRVEDDAGNLASASARVDDDE